MFNDEIVITGKYKGLNLGMKIDLSGQDEKYVAGALAYVSEQIEQKSYEFVLDCKKIDAFAQCGKGLSGVIAFLEANPQGKIKDALAPSIAKPQLMSAAESYFVGALLRKAGVQYKVAPIAAKPAKEDPTDFIGFMGKYKTWVAVKKLGLEKVQDYEVSGILSGINNTIVNKAFDFSGIEKNDAVVEKAVAGKRKSYLNLAAALKALGSAANPYTIAKVCEKLALKPYSSPEMLTAAHPDIKPPKVKGRKPKG